MKEQQLLLETIYPDSAKFSISKIIVPSDLVRLVDDLGKVARYVDPTQVPVGCMVDDVKKHLFRLQWRFLTIPNKSNAPFALNLRKLWIHDAGEHGKASDVVVTAKFIDHQLAHTTELSEKEIARQKLSPQDFELYLDVDTASGYLKGKHEVRPTDEGILFKTADFAEGPLVFFYNYINWLNKNKYDEKVPPESLFVYTLKENNKFRDRIRVTENLNPDVKNLCLYILYQQIHSVVSMWSKVEKNDVPDVMATQLESMNDYLKQNHKE